jgi:predicted phage baseplate assembly protein
MDPDQPHSVKQPVTVIRGNIVLAEHGRSLTVARDDKDLVFKKIPQSGGRYRLALRATEITHSSKYIDTDARKLPVVRILQQDPREAVARITLHDENHDDWLAAPDLLDSGEFTREFVTEIEPNVQAVLRFGDGILGRIPNNETQFTATYIVGNGHAGNVGADSIYHIITSDDGISGVRNPLPASGGTDPESIEEVRQYAPQAFRTQKRAVTAEDYASVAMLHTEVQKAVATLRWTGSWHTLFITIDRKHGRDVDEVFKAQLIEFINQYRLAGHDLEIDPPIYVPLDIKMTVCVKDGYFKDRIKKALLETFSVVDLSGGKTGFFHPDNFTFGQPVYLSRVIDAAMQVPGVKWVDLSGESDCFQRWGETAHDELEDGLITIGRLEIARLDNDPNDPENGKIEFIMKGGL